MTSKEAAAEALKPPVTAAKSAVENQETASNAAMAAANDAQTKVGKAEQDLKTGEQAASDAEAASKTADDRQEALDKDVADAESVLTTAQNDAAAKAKALEEQTRTTELAKQQRDNAKTDYDTKKLHSSDNEEKFERASEEAKHVKNIEIPAAENDVKQAEHTASSTKTAAEEDRAKMVATEAKRKDELSHLQIAEAAEFKEYTKEHKAYKVLERAKSTAQLHSTLDENEKKFYGDDAQKLAARLDSAKELLEERKGQYDHYTAELQKVNAGGEVQELGN